MNPGRDGWHVAEHAANPGDSYGFVIDNTLYPDPAARRQRGDVHGLSVLIDPGDFQWTDNWRGMPWREAVVYELHIGTFTAPGTFDAAREALPRLRDLGITFIEIMPVAQFDGRRGWGYDGVLPYAPHEAYGTPDDFKRLIEAAHHLGIGVILDVVYNHFGPSGNYLSAWCPSFFDSQNASAWGQAIAFGNPAVRSYFIDNALYWLEEFQIDGLRLDAVHAIRDSSETHFLDELGTAVRQRFSDRRVHLIIEDERNLVSYFRENGDFDATWNDDWHHALHCLLTGEAEGYYASFASDPVTDIQTALRDGYVEQGQARESHSHRRGEPSAELPVTAFVNFLGNHDQVGNRAQGERLHHLAPDLQAIRVATAFTLLCPFVPMIFMGDEFLTEAPFLYFTDFHGELAEAVRKGRAAEFAGFGAFGGTVPDPNAPDTARRSQIGGATTAAQRDHQAFVTTLLARRRAHLLPLLAETARPKATVERYGRCVDARWRFKTADLLVRAAFGDTEFTPHQSPFCLVVDSDSPFALSAEVRPTGR